MMRSSLRDNFRYVLVKDEMPDENTQKKISNVLEKFLGVIGIYETGARIIQTEKEYAIIRVVRGFEDKICACFALANNESAKNIRLRVLRISGTIDALCSKQNVSKPKKTTNNKKTKKLLV